MTWEIDIHIDGEQKGQALYDTEEEGLEVALWAAYYSCCISCTSWVYLYENEVHSWTKTYMGQEILMELKDN